MTCKRKALPHRKQCCNKWIKPCPCKQCLIKMNIISKVGYALYKTWKSFFFYLLFCNITSPVFLSLDSLLKHSVKTFGLKINLGFWLLGYYTTNLENSPTSSYSLALSSNIKSWYILHSSSELTVKSLPLGESRGSGFLCFTPIEKSSLSMPQTRALCLETLRSRPEQKAS